MRFQYQGSGDDQFDSPNSVAVDLAGNIYVADTANNRIQKFDSNGNYLTQWGGFGTGDGQFNSPRGVAVDTAGNVYVVEYENNRIQKFDSSGTFLFMWGWDVVTGNAETGLEVCKLLRCGIFLSPRRARRDTLILSSRRAGVGGRDESG